MAVIKPNAYDKLIGHPERPNIINCISARGCIMSLLNPLSGMRHRPRACASRLRVETLEDRTVLSFITPLSYPLPPAGLSMVVGDFNGDGHLDLAEFSSASSPTANGSVNIL